MRNGKEVYERKIVEMDNEASLFEIEIFKSEVDHLKLQQSKKKSLITSKFIYQLIFHSVFI